MVPASVSAGAARKGLVSLKVILPYYPTAEDAGTAVAVVQGFYKQEGLTVTLEEGTTNSATDVDEVASGSVQIGEVASSPYLIQADSTGVPVKAFGAIFTKHPYAFYSLPTDPVTSPKDFIKKTIKTIGAEPGNTVLIDAMLYENGLQKYISTVNKKIVSSASVAPLLDHKEQIQTEWATSAGTLKPLGKHYVQLLLWTTGVHLSADVLFAKTSYITTHKKVLEEFMTATARGWIYARTHRSQAVHDLVKLFKSLTYSETLITLTRCLPYVFNATSLAGGFGTVSASAWTGIAHVYKALGKIKKVPSVSQLLTLSILAATKKARSFK
jgi:NitT/TauT family transport system substrate-binding protein